jgi:hypothetical protein
MMDITGKTFGRWLVLSREPTALRRHAQWLCECQCDARTKRVVLQTNLIEGKSTSCGCTAKDAASSKMIGQTFGLLTVVEKADTNKHRMTAWMCRCACGTSKTLIRVLGNALRSGKTKSCGCLRAFRSVRHGYARSPEYQTWQRVGGRKSCWLRFEDFIACVGERPSPRHQLHRIDQNKPISPDNFKWREPKALWGDAF